MENLSQEDSGYVPVVCVFHIDSIDGKHYCVCVCVCDAVSVLARLVLYILCHLTVGGTFCCVSHLLMGGAICIS